MELWIPITIAAAFSQNLRVALQKHLTERLSALGATYARFVWGLPFAAAYLWLLVTFGGQGLPRLSGAFLAYGAVGGLAQIGATFCLLRAFAYRNFAVGTTYSKTETVQAAIFGILVLGETLSWGASLGIAISLVGVMVISATKSSLSLAGLVLGWVEKPALIGLASGALFGISAVSYRAASLALDSGGFLLRAGTTLVAVLVFQTLVMSVALAIWDRRQILRVFQAWRWTFWVGVTSMIGSTGWFTAMTLQNVAFVRALGQIELVFTFVASTLFFRERSSLVEVSGIVLVVGGILVMLLIR